MSFCTVYVLYVYTRGIVDILFSLKVEGGFAYFPLAVFDRFCHFWSSLSISQSAAVFCCVVVYSDIVMY